MKSVRHISLMLALLLVGCARHHALPTAQASRQIITKAEAIAVVLAEIQRRGGDPRLEECSAKKTDDGWDVIAWHIFYPTNTGSSRFVPEGSKIYIISRDGKILKTIPDYD
jgi:hypothetical protein